MRVQIKPFHLEHVCGNVACPLQGHEYVLANVGDGQLVAITRDDPHTLLPLDEHTCPHRPSEKWQRMWLATHPPTIGHRSWIDDIIAYWNTQEVGMGMEDGL